MFIAKRRIGDEGDTASLRESNQRPGAIYLRE